MQQAYPPPPKKKMSTVMVVLIVFGVLGVLGLGTCGVAAFFINKEVKQISASMGEGGLVVVSPANVLVDLAGPKKDYVGSWRSKRGSALHIGADGTMKLEKDEDGDGVKESLQAPIASFSGDDIQIQMFVNVTVKVASAPKKISDHWEMTADDIHFERK